MGFRLLLCVCPILALFAAGAARAADKVEGSLNFNFYPYLSQVTSDADFTLNAAATLPAGLSYASFVNFTGVFRDTGMQMQNSEQNLRWAFSPRIPFDAAVQAQIGPKNGDDTWQVGPRWRINDTPFLRGIFAALHVSWNVTFFQRFDNAEGSVRQISNNYRVSFPYLSDRLYLSGYLDRGIHHGGRRGRVHLDNTETQLGVRLVGNVYAIAEYRRNEYRATDRDNLAVGLEFKSRW